MSVIHLSNENFDELIKEGKVLVDFYAAWCGPCKMIGPVIEEIANERTDIKVIKVNVDEHGEIAQKYGVMSIPTLILFNNGNVEKQNVGFIPKENILELIDTN